MVANFSSGSRIWSRETFGSCQLGNTLRTERLVDYASRQAARPHVSTNAACGGSSAAAEGAYRFLENDSVSPMAIAEGAFESTARRHKGSRKNLILMDMTGQTFTHSSVSDELVGYNKDDDLGRGWKVHSSLVVDVESKNKIRVLGLIDQVWWQRDPKGPGKAMRKQRPYEEKESFKWQAASERIGKRLGDMSNTVTVCDREADIFEFLRYKRRAGEGFLVRANHNRKVESDEGFLWETLKKQTKAFEMKIKIPQRGATGKKGARKERTAVGSVRFGEIVISHSKYESIVVNAVWVIEEDPPQGIEPIEWMLLTSEAVNTQEDAERIIQWYRLRWMIEDFHRTWKSICTASKRRMQYADNLQRLLIILGFIAVRLLQLRSLADADPGASCMTILSQTEWECLYRTQHESNKIPKTPLTVNWALEAIAKLGGWRDTKGTGRKGIESLARGFTAFLDIVRGYELALRSAKT